MNLKCSQCGTKYEFVYNKDEPLPPNFPFCSKRCKSLDLGKWLNEEYRISSPVPQDYETSQIEPEATSEASDENIQQILRVARNLNGDTDSALVNMLWSLKKKLD